MASLKRVLIPTDFSVNSLRIVLEFLENHTAEEQLELELVLVYGLQLSDSITSLLAFNKEDCLADLQSEDFIKGCEIIRTRYKDKLTELYADVLTSKNPRYLQNYIKGHRIQQVIILEGLSFSPTARHNFDVNLTLKGMEKQLAVPLLHLQVPEEMGTQRDLMDGIFFRKKWRLSYE